MRLLCIRQPHYFNEYYAKTENFFYSFFSLLCAVHIFQVEKSGSEKCCSEKELEPTGYVTWEVPNNEKDYCYYI